MFLAALLAAGSDTLESSDPPWSTTEWLVLGSLPMTAVALSFADASVRDFAQDHRSPATRAVSAGAKVLGDGRLVVPLSGLLWGVGAYREDSRLSRASVNALEAWSLTQLVTQTGKYTLGRARPHREQGELAFTGFALSDDDFRSFPSGHSSTAWGILPAYAMEYHDLPWLSGGLYALAAATGLSRVHDDEHWLSDVVFSAGVGWLSNRAVRSWNGRDRDTKVWLVPTGDGFVASVRREF